MRNTLFLCAWFPEKGGLHDEMDRGADSHGSLTGDQGLLLLGEEKISVERKKGSRYAITTKRNGSKEN